MHTSHLIQLLQENEHGGNGHEPRQISIYAANNEGRSVLVMSKDSHITVIGSCDESKGLSLTLEISGYFYDETTENLLDKVNLLEAEIEELKKQL